MPATINESVSTISCDGAICDACVIIYDDLIEKSSTVAKKYEDTYEKLSPVSTLSKADRAALSVAQGVVIDGKADMEKVHKNVSAEYAGPGAKLYTIEIAVYSNKSAEQVIGYIIDGYYNFKTATIGYNKIYRATNYVADTAGLEDFSSVTGDEITQSESDVDYRNAISMVNSVKQPIISTIRPSIELVAASESDSEVTAIVDVPTGLEYTVSDEGDGYKVITSKDKKIISAVVTSILNEYYERSREWVLTYKNSISKLASTHGISIKLTADSISDIWINDQSSTKINIPGMFKNEFMGSVYDKISSSMTEDMSVKGEETSITYDVMQDVKTINGYYDRVVKVAIHSAVEPLADKISDAFARTLPNGSLLSGILSKNNRDILMVGVYVDESKRVNGLFCYVTDSITSKTPKEARSPQWVECSDAIAALIDKMEELSAIKASVMEEQATINRMSSADKDDKFGSAFTSKAWVTIPDGVGELESFISDPNSLHKSLKDELVSKVIDQATKLGMVITDSTQSSIDAYISGSINNQQRATLKTIGLNPDTGCVISKYNRLTGELIRPDVAVTGDPSKSVITIIETPVNKIYRDGYFKVPYTGRVRLSVETSRGSKLYDAIEASMGDEDFSVIRRNGSIRVDVDIDGNDGIAARKDSFSSRKYIDNGAGLSYRGIKLFGNVNGITVSKIYQIDGVGNELDLTETISEDIVDSIRDIIVKSDLALYGNEKVTEEATSTDETIKVTVSYGSDVVTTVSDLKYYSGIDKTASPKVKLADLISGGTRGETYGMIPLNGVISIVRKSDGKYDIEFMYGSDKVKVEGTQIGKLLNVVRNAVNEYQADGNKVGAEREFISVPGIEFTISGDLSLATGSGESVSVTDVNPGERILSQLAGYGVSIDNGKINGTVSVSKGDYGYANVVISSGESSVTIKDKLLAGKIVAYIKNGTAKGTESYGILDSVKTLASLPDYYLGDRSLTSYASDSTVSIYGDFKSKVVSNLFGAVNFIIGELNTAKRASSSKKYAMDIDSVMAWARGSKSKLSSMIGSDSNYTRNEEEVEARKNEIPEWLSNMYSFILDSDGALDTIHRATTAIATISSRCSDRAGSAQVLDNVCLAAASVMTSILSGICKPALATNIKDYSMTVRLDLQADLDRALVTSKNISENTAMVSSIVKSDLINDVSISEMSSTGLTNRIIKEAFIESVIGGINSVSDTLEDVIELVNKCKIETVRSVESILLIDESSYDKSGLLSEYHDKAADAVARIGVKATGSKAAYTSLLMDEMWSAAYKLPSALSSAVEAMKYIAMDVSSLNRLVKGDKAYSTAKINLTKSANNLKKSVTGWLKTVSAGLPSDKEYASIVAVHEKVMINHDKIQRSFAAEASKGVSLVNELINEIHSGEINSFIDINVATARKHILDCTNKILTFVGQKEGSISYNSLVTLASSGDLALDVDQLDNLVGIWQDGFSLAEEWGQMVSVMKHILDIFGSDSDSVSYSDINTIYRDYEEGRLDSVTNYARDISDKVTEATKSDTLSNYIAIISQIDQLFSRQIKSEAVADSQEFINKCKEAASLAITKTVTLVATLKKSGLYTPENESSMLDFKETAYKVLDAIALAGNPGNKKQSSIATRGDLAGIENSVKPDIEPVNTVSASDVVTPVVQPARTSRRSARPI